MGSSRRSDLGSASPCSRQMPGEETTRRRAGADARPSRSVSISPSRPVPISTGYVPPAVRTSTCCMAVTIAGLVTSGERADYIVIGSGIAGLRAALALAGAGRTVVLTKAEPTAGNTGYAQGGIAAAVGAGDSPEAHLADTLAAGDGLCDEAAARVLTT